ncbi:hypothetical protein WH47_03433, partial [Habropoda laboriosa]
APGHVLAAREAPPIAWQSGRAQGRPRACALDPFQAQPLPWLFPNFRACGAPLRRTPRGTYQPT